MDLLMINPTRPAFQFWVCFKSADFVRDIHLLLTHMYVCMYVGKTPILILEGSLSFLSNRC